MSNAFYVVLAICLAGTLWGNVKKYRENRDEFTRWELIGSGFALTGLLCLLAAKMVETFWI